MHDRLLSCIVENKAANVIQRCGNTRIRKTRCVSRHFPKNRQNHRCCHRYYLWLVTEKWHVMIQMEKNARKTKDKLASDMAKRRELHKRTTLTNMKRNMERQAIAAGCWDPKGGSLSRLLGCVLVVCMPWISCTRSGAIRFRYQNASHTHTPARAHRSKRYGQKLEQGVCSSRAYAYSCGG